MLDPMRGRYLKDGRINMDFLLGDFQQYWRENSEIWKDRYRENFYEYMDKVGENSGWLVLFDRDAAKSWDEKVYMRKEKVQGKEITLAGC